MAMWPVLGRWVRDEFSLFLPTLDPPARLQRPRHNRNTLIGQDCSLPAHQKGWIELFKRWELDAHKQAVHLLKCAAAHLSREKGRPRIASFVIFTFWCEGPSVQVWACLEETRICRWNSSVGLLCRLSHWDFLQELGLQCWYFYSSGVCQRPTAAGSKWAHGALQQPLSTGLLSAWAPPRVPAWVTSYANWPPPPGKRGPGGQKGRCGREEAGSAGEWEPEQLWPPPSSPSVPSKQPQ